VALAVLAFAGALRALASPGAAAGGAPPQSPTSSTKAVHVDS
jgi:hypothetical protein